MKFAKWSFYAAALYGFISLPPLYFLETMAAPGLTHPEYYYGFIGTAIACQILFVVIGRDPVRMRPAMPAAMVEKLSFVVALGWLYALHRLPGNMLLFAAFDALWAALFIASWRKTPRT